MCWWETWLSVWTHGPKLLFKESHVQKSIKCILWGEIPHRLYLEESFPSLASGHNALTGDHCTFYQPIKAHTGKHGQEKYLRKNQKWPLKSKNIMTLTTSVLILEWENQHGSGGEDKNTCWGSTFSTSYSNKGAEEVRGERRHCSVS